MHHTTQPFASQLSFLDPQFTKEGKPYGPERYKQIVRERYIISKSINTSYIDVGQITPLERRYILEFMQEDAKKLQERMKDSENTAKKIPVPRARPIGR